MKYVVEYRNINFNNMGHWDDDEQFDDLTDAIEYAAKECTNNPRMQHRIVVVHEVKQVMFFPSLEEVLES
tara:strand:- start:263 stop:472 length:210 start_codon:yes stop_codon:yes gene_type:complete